MERSAQQLSQSGFSQQNEEEEVTNANMHHDSGNKGIPKTQTPITVIFRITVVVLVMKAAQSSGLLIQKTVTLALWTWAGPGKGFSLRLHELYQQKQRTLTVQPCPQTEESAALSTASLVFGSLPTVSNLCTHFLTRPSLCYKAEFQRCCCTQGGQEGCLQQTPMKISFESLEH